jgi:hypothetical protein
MTVSARVLYAAVLRMGSVVDAIVEETAAVARDICRKMPTISHRRTDGKLDAYCASEVALLHRLECLRDRVANFDAAFFEFLSRSP